MGNYVDYDTEQSTKKLLVAWYGSQANNWTISADTVVAVADILQTSNKCGAIFKFVPQPSGAFSGVGVITSTVFNYAKDAIKQVASDNQLYYNSCVKDAAASERTRVYMSTF